ncbi:hypothetical protein JAO29_23270, partial [Edaphobacter sp. HDX4]|uniref:hypothetical protein n=1 Tax=Edaphobacter sp. HDX4 TaxID=2794064 RepID=UPI002FE61EFD
SFERTRVASHNTQQRLIAAAAGWIHLILTNRGAELAKSAAKAAVSEGEGKSVSARAATAPVAPTINVDTAAVHAGHASALTEPL